MMTSSFQFAVSSLVSSEVIDVTLVTAEPEPVEVVEETTKTSEPIPEVIAVRPATSEKTTPVERNGHGSTLKVNPEPAPSTQEHIELAIYVLHQNEFVQAVQVLEDLVSGEEFDRNGCLEAKDVLLRAKREGRFYGPVEQVLFYHVGQLNRRLDTLPRSTTASPKTERPPEDLTAKAARILRHLGHEAAAEVLEGQATVEERQEALQQACDDSRVPGGIKQHQLRPRLRALRQSDAQVWEKNWHELALEALTKFMDGIRQVIGLLNVGVVNRLVALHAQKVLAWIETIDLRSYYPAIEEMISQERLPGTAHQLFTDHPTLAYIFAEAVNAEPGTRAKTFRSGLLAEMREAVRKALPTLSPPVYPRPNGFKPKQLVRSPGKTARSGLSEEQRRAKQRAKQLARSAKCKAMKGHNPSPPKHGQKKSKK
jgi:hypothetical protein